MGGGEPRICLTKVRIACNGLLEQPDALRHVLRRTIPPVQVKACFEIALYASGATMWSPTDRPCSGPTVACTSRRIASATSLCSVNTSRMLRSVCAGPKGFLCIPSDQACGDTNAITFPKDGSLDHRIDVQGFRNLPRGRTGRP